MPCDRSKYGSTGFASICFTCTHWEQVDVRPALGLCDLLQHAPAAFGIGVSCTSCEKADDDECWRRFDVLFDAIQEKQP